MELLILGTGSQDYYLELETHYNRLLESVYGVAHPWDW